jgi:hypothetical protein
MTKSFADAFGSDAKLMRSTGGTSSPFYIDATTATPTTNWMGHDVKTYSGGQWRYNPATQAFDYYATNPNGNALLGLLQFQDQSSKSISAADLGLTDPAYQIASLASLAGQNGDSWSNYALTHNDYGGGVGSASSMMAGARDLRNAIGDINSYEAKRSGWESFMDKAWMVPLMVAGAGLLSSAGTLGATEAGAGTLGATEAGAGTLGATANGAADLIATGGANTGAGVVSNGTAGVFGPMGPAAGGNYLSAFGPAQTALGSGLTNEVGSGLIGSTLGGASPATLGQIVGQATGAINAAGGATGALIPGVNAMYDFAAGTLAPAVADASGNLVLASSLGGDIAGGGGFLGDLASGAKSVSDALGGVGGKALGALAGGMLGATGGAKQAGVTTTTKAPWEPMQPYLLDAARAAQQNYNTARTMTPQQDALLSQAQGISANQLNSPGMLSMQNAANGILSGNGSMFSPVGNVDAYTAGPAAAASAAQGQFNLGSLGLGSAPQDAYTRMLSGKADTTTLDPVVNSALRRLSDNFNEQVVPNIGGSANVSGQYGGSRHGIAEGLAAKGLAQSMGDTSAAMYNSAYNNAQNLMGNAAGQLGGFATSIANNNASLATQTNIANANAQNAMSQFNANAQNAMSQFNANLGLHNNAQRLSQMNSAADWLNTSNNMQNTAIKNSLDLANYKNTYANDALNNYTGTIGKFAGMGGTASQPYYTNPTNNLLGGAIAGSQIFKSIFS